MSVKVKICDVRTLDIVECCRRAGADYIGIHQIKAPLSDDKRNLLSNIRDISGEMEIVLVTQEDNMERLVEMCIAFEWDYIQLHFYTTENYVNKLKSKLCEQCKKVPGIIVVIETAQLESVDVKKMYQVADYILFDSSLRGGTGITSSEEALYKIAEFSGDVEYFVAGGLTSENIIKTINISKPYSVDVQSGVEHIKHQKDPQKIIDFINKVKGYNGHRMEGI